MSIFKNIYLQYSILILAIFFIVFFKLDAFPFRLWDESMFAVNAYEMNANGQYGLPFFNGVVDFRQTKPLLLTWIHVGFIKVFGFNELAIRLPSALAAGSTIIAIFYFLRKHGNALLAWVGAIVLLTSVGYVTFHTGRTGDADALLTLFTTLACLQFFNWLIEGNDKYLIYIAIFIGLGILTKSFAAFIFVMPFIILAAWFKRRKAFGIFKSKFFYIGLGILILAIFIAFGYREMAEPGFIQRTITKDAGRLFDVVEYQNQPWDFYIENIFYNRFSFWTVLFFLGAVLAFVYPFSNQNLTIVFKSTFIIFLTYLTVISISTTKLIWYDMPLYPLMAILAANPVMMLFEKLDLSQSVQIIAFLILAIIPLRKAFFNAQANNIPEGDKKIEALGFYLHQQVKQKNFDSFSIWHQGYLGTLLCYKYMYLAEGANINIKYTNDFSIGEKVLVADEALKLKLISTHAVDTLEYNKNVLLTQIK